MNSKLFTLAFIGLILTVSASQATFEALEKVKANEFANDFIGQQIVDTVLLQQQSGGSADIIIRLLNGLINDLNVQQRKHDHEHTANNKLWAKQLKNYRYNVKKLTRTINHLSTRILKLQAAIRVSKHNIQNTQIQLKIVRHKQADLKAARNVDHQAFVKRHARQGEMVKAVRYIIVQLQLALKSQKFVELDNIKAELQRLTKENPLQALVQLTMTFNPASVAYAIKKLKEVSSGLTASVKDDVRGEKQAVRQFHKLNNQMNSFIKHAEVLLHNQKAKLARQQTLLASLLRQRREARKLRKQFRRLIAHVLSERKAYNANWKLSKKHRHMEVGTIRKVIGILQKQFPEINSSEKLAKSLSKH